MISLVHTTVDDARSSLVCQEHNGHLDIAGLEAALRYLAEKFPDQKTKRQLFERTLKRWKKMKETR